MTQEEQPISEINSHIEEYLDYYCGLPQAPGFAVLLKGEWGCGKTWFINKYREKLEKKKQKCLYVSLYGMTSFSEIESLFFFKFLMALSIEIKRGALLTKDISKFQEAQLNDPLEEELKLIKTIIDKFDFLDLLFCQPPLGLQWWEKFFDKGIVDMN